MGKISGTVLIVDDDPFILDTAKMYLKQEIDEVITESNPARVTDHLDAKEIDVVLLDMNYRKGDMEGKEGILWLEKFWQLIPLSLSS